MPLANAQPQLSLAKKHILFTFKKHPNHNEMNTVKRLREKAGLTQSQLAEKAGISLRTIQRLEASHKAPKAYTLTALAKVFDIAPAELQNGVYAAKSDRNSDVGSIKLINLSALAFFLFPFGNIILPIVLWQKSKQSELVDDAGRIIINFQILWTLILYFLLSVSPFVDSSPSTAYPLILKVLFVALGVNLIVILLSAHWIRLGKIHRLKLPIKLL